METVKRGYVPKDTIEFGPKAAAKLNAAAQELAFLLDRGYDTKSTSTFVGNHHLLSERQRLALARITSPRAALEVALSGSLLLEGMDGTIRDLAGLRGSYRIVDKTVRAVELLLARLEALEVKEALFYLDQQVSNSGRLRALLLDKAAERSVQIQVELHPSVDGVLSRLEHVVTTDAIIQDKCGSWYNLNRGIIEEAVPEAWVFRLEKETWHE